MTEQEMRKGGGGKLSRSETVTVRLDPKLRYLAELAARMHRRTLSSYIEWAIKDSLDKEPLRPANLHSGELSDHTIGNEAEYLWDVDEADRFAKLALRYPHLLTHEEQVRWKLIRENGHLWRGSFARSNRNWSWTIDEGSMIFDRLREHWVSFCAVAEGTSEKSILPTWQKVEGAASSASKPPAKSAFDEHDDDIPF
jgi:predicted transcriptional regulator